MWYLFFLGFSLISGSLFSGEALKRLMDGNVRYVQDRLEHPNRTSESRTAAADSQSPFAIIVGCSDSRVAPEILFDQGIGDLFVVRVAGNVIGPIELDSVEYSALYLNSKVILVMGHESCGAVDAVIQGKTKDIEAVAKIIEPVVRKAKKTKSPDLLNVCIKKNALNMKEFLKNSPSIRKLVQEGKIEVEAAYYNLNTGVVEILN